MERTYVDELETALVKLSPDELRELETELFEDYFFGSGSRDDWRTVRKAVRWKDREDDYYQ